MRTFTALLISAVAAVAVPGQARAGADLSIRDLPEPVKETLFRETMGGLLKDIEEERYGGRSWFQIEYTAHGEDWEIDIAPDGRLLARRRD